MVYTRTVELSRLGAAWLGASVNNATATSAYEDVVVALANNTDPFSIPAAPDPYAGYDKESVCFVEPMVRFTPRKTLLAALGTSGTPRFRARKSGVTVNRRPLECRENPRIVCPLARRTRRLTRCVPPVSQEASHGAEAIMFIFIAGVVLGAVPQYLKLILLATSEGISLTSLALMNVSNVTATLNIFILHFEQIKQCVKQADRFTFDSCQASLLTFYYTLVYTLLWFPLYPLAAHFCAEKKVEHCGVVASGRAHAHRGLVAHLVPCLILAAPVVRMVLNGGCFGFESYAMLLGVMNAVLEATRYLPQVVASWHSEGSGALSYLRLLLSIGGGVGATVQKALMHEDISTWFPPLVGHSLEIVIVAINLYHDVSGARERGARVGGSAFGSERGDDGGESGGGGGESRSEATPLTGASHASRTAAVNRAMERGERENAQGTKGAARANAAASSSDAESDWIDDLPAEASAFERGEYVCNQMCTNPKFLNALLKYM